MFRESIKILVDKEVFLSKKGESPLEKLLEQGKIYDVLSSMLFISVVAEIGESLKDAISKIVALLDNKNTTSGAADNGKEEGRISNFYI